MDQPETVTAAVELLQAEGFDGDFAVAEAAVHCSRCAGSYEPARLIVRQTFRFEGETDPGDEAIVLGVECPECGSTGVIVSAYGPDADADLLALLDRLT